MSNDVISWQMAIDMVRRCPVKEVTPAYMLIDKAEVMTKLMLLLPATPEYKPVTAEDFAKIMSENTTYNFVAWHQEAITLMDKMGFVICKKMMCGGGIE